VRAAAALAALLCASAAGAEDTARFEAAFKSCRPCHSLTPGKGSTAGPHLGGLKERVLGSAEGYDYSPGFQAARRQGLRWDAQRLAAYLDDPDAVVPGGWMSRPGGLSADDRAALVDHLLR
jgi:cytochrome c2